ncbi:hypothetical protein SCLCIDRAFT_606958, partial [Scleroderma citrinum Foug A]
LGANILVGRGYGNRQSSWHAWWTLASYCLPRVCRPALSPQNCLRGPRHFRHPWHQRRHRGVGTIPPRHQRIQKTLTPHPKYLQRSCDVVLTSPPL